MADKGGYVKPAEPASAGAAPRGRRRLEGFPRSPGRSAGPASPACSAGACAVVVDGTHLHVPANPAVTGRYPACLGKSQDAEAGYPLLRLLALVECGTCALLAVVSGPDTAGERPRRQEPGAGLPRHQARSPAAQPSRAKEAARRAGKPAVLTEGVKHQPRRHKGEVGSASRFGRLPDDPAVRVIVARFSGWRRRVLTRWRWS